MIPRSSLSYVLAQLRCPTHLLECPHWASLRIPEVRWPRKNACAGCGAGFGRLSGGRIFASSGDWDSGSLAFTLLREPLGALLHTPGRSRRFSVMLFSLTGLSTSG